MPRYPRAARAPTAAAAVALLAVLVGGCQDESSDLEDYTDRGDACPQAVSAMGYADDALRPLGQEPYQEFDDAVRSRLSAVEGTLSLEARDWPDRGTAEQARRVQALAADAASGTAGPQRERALLEYRIEAARLVLACRDATG